MTDLSKPTAPEAADLAEKSETVRAKRPYEPPQCEKKRSIHRVTLISGVGNMSVGALSVMGG
jgi:hypothetical protein